MGKSSRPNYFNLQTPIQADPEVSLLGGLRSYHIGSISTHMFRGRVRRSNGKAGCEPGQKRKKKGCQRYPKDRGSVLQKSTLESTVKLALVRYSWGQKTDYTWSGVTKPEGCCVQPLCRSL